MPIPINDYEFYLLSTDPKPTSGVSGGPTLLSGSKCFEVDTGNRYYWSGSAWVLMTAADMVVATTGSGSGGPATIADGADVTQGAIADAAVGDANGTVNSHLRFVAKGLGEVTASPTANTLLDRIKALLTGIILAAGNAIIGKVGIDQTTPGTTNRVVAGGIVASGAANSGNPLKGGVVYNATLPTLVDGQVGDAQGDSRAQHLVNLGVQLDPTNDGVRAVPTDGVRATYSASVTALAPAASATDIFEIIGSATKTVIVTRLRVGGVATAAGAYDFQLVKRSVANTVGTSSAPTPVRHDSNDGVATAALKAYTANPTLGTAVGTLQSQKGVVSTAAGAIPIVPTVFEPSKLAKGYYLRGVAESLCLNLNGTTMTGGNLDIDIEWIEF